MWKSKFYSSRERRAPGGSGDRCTLPWEGRVTGPLNLQEPPFLVRRCSSDRGQAARKSSTSLPGNLRELDLDTYKILTSTQIVTDRREVSSLLSAAICGKSKFYSLRKESSWGPGTGAPYPGRVGSPVPLNLQEPPFSFDDVHQIEAFQLPGRVVPPFRATWRELDLDILIKF